VGTSRPGAFAADARPADPGAGPQPSACSREEAEALCETLNEHFAGRLDILPVQPQRWSARLQMELEVSASSSFDMAGRELQAPLPADALLNEAQMVLHEHPVTRRAKRAASRQSTASGCGAPAACRRKRKALAVGRRRRSSRSGLARLAGARQRGLPASATAWLERLPQDGRLWWCSTNCGSIRKRPSCWSGGGLPPLLAALRAGRIGMLTVHVPDSPTAPRSRPSAATCAASGAGRRRSGITHEDHRAELFRNGPPRAGGGWRASAARAHFRRATHRLGG